MPCVTANGPRGASGRSHSRAPGTQDPKTAEFARLRAEPEDEGKDPRPKPTETPLEALPKWLDALKALGRGQSTVDGYSDKVHPVLEALKGTPLAQWDAELVASKIFGRPTWSPTTKRHAVTSVAAFLAWARRQRMPVPPALPEELRDLPHPAVRIQDRAVATETEIVRLLDVARTFDATHRTLPLASKHGRRPDAAPWLEAAVALAGLAGLSLSDIRALQADEIDLDAARMWRKGGRSKTGERYDVPLSPRVVEALRPQLQEAGPALKLPSQRAMASALHRLCVAAGVARPRGGAWHWLRHSFGTLLSARRVDLATIRLLMGHAPGSTVTLRYLHPERDRAAAAVQQLGLEG